MARAVWGGALTFGLVSLPVRLFTATDSHAVHFHQLERGTSDRVRNRRVNERTGDEVPLDAIVKGYDVGDEYVLVEPGELDDIAPGRSKSLEIDGFVDLDDIAPVFFDKTYYLAPKGKDFGKTYALLAKAMEHQDKAAIATFVMRNREYLVAVKAESGLLTLHTLHWADEIRDPRKLDSLPGRVKVSDREVRMAERLIDELSMEWDPEEFHDTYQERVARLVEAKRTGEPVERADPPAESTNVVDLMDALRASVDRAKKPTDLGSLTKKELYEKAAEAGVPGRSSMNRDELVKALSETSGRRRSAA
ncbi:non-homologous end joining protein Ku [Streptomyces xanthii]|uniref:Non-homologous end joining protein Ku n=1 Tax=Streptomyces xanthii TaxID=2768069 RepID=A0A7H1B1Q1_9ACTN|nr:Ku protein [Streptomyces xanthii]QNS02656.1 Ku protein [Streptomyces xanthii]